MLILHFTLHQYFVSVFCAHFTFYTESLITDLFYILYYTSRVVCEMGTVMHCPLYQKELNLLYLRLC